MLVRVQPPAPTLPTERARVHEASGGTRRLPTPHRLPCGAVAVNGFTEGDVETPFGGYKRSGSVARENGVEALDQYVQTKTIWISVGATEAVS